MEPQLPRASQPWQNAGAKVNAAPRGVADVQEEDAACAAARCYQQLREGTYVASDGKRRSIAGDTSKLYFAEGTTRKQRELLRNFHFVGGAQAGTQEVRRRMGKIGFSARIVYGTSLFCTISPSERHGGLALRLSRYREGDPMLSTPSAEQERRWIGQDAPSLEGTVTVELPDYDLRRVIMARDPLAAADAFNVFVRVVLARLLGIRMCPECPHCNKGDSPCQDIFGSNAEPQGGIFGRVDSLFGGVECQRSGALHLHFSATVQQAHQHKTLHEIAELIRDKLLSVDALKTYHTYVCKETYPDLDQQRSEAAALEQEWHRRHRDDRELGQMPDFLFADTGLHLLSADSTAESLRTDAAAWLQQYDAAAQYRMARVQHHMHTLDATGERRPLAACLAKGTRDTCKAGFPKDNLLTEQPLLVCEGIARARGLRTGGQQNSLGKILGRRNDPWLNGTAQAFTVAFGFNTDTKPNNRIPVIVETHEDTCPCPANCVGASSELVVAAAAQNAQTQTNGYFGGYQVKIQPAGRYDLKKCVDKMHILRERTKCLPASDKVRAVTRRMLTDLECRGTLRGAVEVFNLCVNFRENDSTAQECIRTFRTASLNGSAFLRRLEAELGAAGALCVSTMIPPTR